MSSRAAPARGQQQQQHQPLLSAPPPPFLPSFVPSQSPCSPHFPSFCPYPPPFSYFYPATPCWQTPFFSRMPHPNPSPSACFSTTQWPWIVPFPCGCRPYLMPCAGPPCPPCHCCFSVPSTTTAHGFVGSSSRYFTAPASEVEHSASARDADNKDGGHSLAFERLQTCPSSDDVNNLKDECKEGEENVEEQEPQFILSDEWAEFFAKSEARRREKKAQQKKAKQAAKQKLRPSFQQEDDLQMPSLPDKASSSDVIGEIKACVAAESSRFHEC